MGGEYETGRLNHHGNASPREATQIVGPENARGPATRAVSDVACAANDGSAEAAPLTIGGAAQARSFRAGEVIVGEARRLPRGIEAHLIGTVLA